MRVKICGITTPADAIAAAEAGADAVGLNFVGGPRRIDPDQASEILRTLPPFVTPVALLRLENGSLPTESADLLTRLKITHVQLYGQSAPTYLATLVDSGLRPIPVIHVQDERFTRELENWWRPETSAARPAGVILDAYDPHREGGTGKTFRWDWVVEAKQSGRLADWPPIVLAGGLNPENVAEAVRIVQPYGVDVSSGVETEGAPGRKDPEKMRRFIHNAKHAAMGRETP